MEGTPQFSKTRLARNYACAILLFVLLLAGCDGMGETEAPETESLPVNAVESSVIEGDYEETLTAFLDRDGSDGYVGDYVLVYHPALEGGSKPMGTLDGLVETTSNQVPSREGTYLQTTDIYKEKDPYLTDEIRQADLCYDLTDGDLWQVGFQRVFYIDGLGLPWEMLFQVSAVGARCRVWSPVNPAYGPLEGIDPSYPEQLAWEMDTAIPVLEQSFGAIPDVRGDGKMNILCFDFNSPNVLGFTSYFDIYDEVLVNGRTIRNHLPIAYVNTAPLIQGTYSGLSEVYTDAVHEMEHTIFFAQCGEGSSIVTSVSKRLFGEFLSIVAQEVVYPGSGICHSLPWWYSGTAVWEDLAADRADIYLRDKKSDRQSGKSMFKYTSYREDYAAMLLLAHFIENRSGRNFLMNVIDCIDMDSQDTKELWKGIWGGLGYEDYPSFMEDFLLSILLHEEDGPYQLHPFKGYDPASCDGEENPFSHLVPIITDTGLYVEAGGFTVLRPVGGVYHPPVTASKDLCYVGITLKGTE